MTEAAQETLNHLGRRLARLEFHLRDASDEASPSARDEGEPVAVHEPGIARVAGLERRFTELRSKFPQAGELLRLQRNHPDIFDYDTKSIETERSTMQKGAEELSVILASEKMLMSTTSNLTALQSQHMPHTDALVSLALLQPQVERALAMSEKQWAEVEELRRRSAEALVYWYEISVLEEGERWADWEERLRRVEMAVRRKETARSRERNDR